MTEIWRGKNAGEFCQPAAKQGWLLLARGRGAIWGEGTCGPYAICIMSNVALKKKRTICFRSFFFECFFFFLSLKTKRKGNSENQQCRKQMKQERWEWKKSLMILSLLCNPPELLFQGHPKIHSFNRHSMKPCCGTHSFVPLSRCYKIRMEQLLVRLR